MLPLGCVEAVGEYPYPRNQWALTGLRRGQASAAASVNKSSIRGGRECVLCSVNGPHVGTISMARRPKKDETHYFRVTFEDGSSEKWGFHPLDLRGNHMARQFVREREEREAKLEKREARKITSVSRISGYLKKSRGYRGQR